MSGLLTLPSNFNEIMQKFHIKPYKVYNYPANYFELKPMEKIAEICKVKDSKFMIDNNPEYVLGNYVKELMDLYNKADPDNESDRFVYLKLLFIYKHLQSKVISSIEALATDDILEDITVDKYTHVDFEIDLLHNGLKDEYKDLLQNYHNYCILKDYIDNRFGNNETAKYDRLNFNNYSRLKLDEMVFFLKNIKMEMMDFREMFELILSISSLDKQKFYRLEAKYQLGFMFRYLELYNIHPHAIYCSKEKKRQLLYEKYMDSSDEEEDYYYSSSDNDDMEQGGEDDFEL
jgi:hypothetical protein